MTDFATERENVGEGWRSIIEQLHNDLVKLDPEYTVDQIKEKFGGLRYYATSHSANASVSNQFHDLIDAAERKSLSTCEFCGQPGKQTPPPRWIKTLCGECR